jgi:hypothetical protein
MASPSVVQDHEAITIDNFRGLYGRGQFDDSVPQNFFIDSLNTISSGNGEVRTRYGFTKSITTSFSIRRTAVYKRQGEASRLLILDSTGKLYDASVSLVTPILNIASMTDFSLLTFYNRAYISPHDGSYGLSGEFVYVYQGSGTARKAAGVAAIGGFNVAFSASAGYTEAGTHILAVCYETDSGFITPPGPTSFPTIEADGAHQLSLTNIPTGPTGTSKRHIIASRAIQDYDGNQDGYEMFFVPNGTLNNNSDTTLTIDFFDADLQESADYTFDQLDEIPAVAFLSAYKGKACFGGSNADKSLVYVSKDNEPESVNSEAGFIVCDPHETEGVKCAVEFRDNLYITKGNPGHTYVTTDNGYEASTWNLTTLDKGIGADINGLSQYLDSRGSNADFFMAADISGLYLFDGSYIRPELSYGIQNFWARINKAYFNKVQLIIDSKNFLIYVLVPLDSATHPSHIFVGDYADGLAADKIIWHKWAFTSVSPVSIVVDINSTTAATFLRVAGYTGNVYNYDITSYSDDSVAYESYVKFALVNLVENWIHHFAAVGLRIKGNGTLLITAYGLDAAVSASLNSLALASSPGREYIIPFNFSNEKCSIKIDLNTIDKHFELYTLNVYAQPFWATRPG